MSSCSRRRVDRIWQIVQLKQIMRRWHSLSLRRRPSPSGNVVPPPGFLAVYAGTERCRFVIPTHFLNLPVFAALLKNAEDEFGFQPHGALVLPCNADFFAFIVTALRRDEGRYCVLGIEGFVEMFAQVPLEPSSCKDEFFRARCSTALPLLLKARV